MKNVQHYITHHAMVDFKCLKAYALKQFSKLIQQEVHKGTATFDDSCHLQ